MVFNVPKLIVNLWLILLIYIDQILALQAYAGDILTM
jgi:hypothetical protein